MNEIKKFFFAIVSSLIVSVIILVVSYSLMTDEFPPRFERIKNSYKIYNKLKDLAPVYSDSKLDFESNTDAELTDYLLYKKNLSDLSQNLIGQVDATKDTSLKVISAVDVASRIRRETMNSQLESINYISTQKMKEENIQLKAENLKLKKIIEQLRVK
ncbi:MAG: hypothetical protein WA160_04785 [Pseudobdellovibrio sp.]